MERTKIISFIGLIGLGILTGIFTPLYFITNANYNSLLDDYRDLEEDHQDLSDDYYDLLNDYHILTGDYNTLFDDYEDLEAEYNSTCSTIKQQILPIQYSVFAEAVRRYYMPIYLEDKSGKEYWKSFAEFCRDIILHDTEQENSFNTVSNAFSNALKFGSNTMYLSHWIMSYTLDYCDTINYWELDELTGMDDLSVIDIIVQECIDNIDYENDSNINYGQEYFTWDYAKFSIETAFRTMGDCEDQSILCASYLESCGFETAIALIHDSDHPTLGELYHSACLVHIEDTSAFWDAYPSCGLWRFSSGDPYYPEYTWCWLDSSWDVPFGSEPLWLQDYSYLSYSICSIGFCDIDGAVI